MFLEALVNGKHVAVFGASKTGKSSLIENKIGDFERLYIQCTESFSKSDFNDALLEAVYKRVKIEEEWIQSRKTLDTTKAGLNVNSAPIIASIMRNYEKRNGYLLRTTDKKEFDLTKIGDFVSLFEDQGYSRSSPKDEYLFLIIDDFHKASRVTQRWVADLAKVLYDNTRVVVICVGIWIEETILNALCPELTGRTEDITCNVWEDDDLLEVINEGCKRLKIRFPKGFSETVVKHSKGSVFLVQEACKEACRQVGVTESFEETTILSKSLNAKNIVNGTIRKHCNFTDIHSKLLAVEGDNTKILFVYYSLITRPANSIMIPLDMGKLQKRIIKQFKNLDFGNNFAHNACVRFAVHEYADRFKTIFRIFKDLDGNVAIALIEPSFSMWLKGKRPQIKADIEEKLAKFFEGKETLD